MHNYKFVFSGKMFVFFNVMREEELPQVISDEY